MLQVQITVAVHRCIWPEASLDPVEHAVPRYIKATAATRELSLLILTSTRVDSVSVAHAPYAVEFASVVFLIHNNVVTLSQVLHIDQND